MEASDAGFIYVREDGDLKAYTFSSYSDYETDTVRTVYRHAVQHSRLNSTESEPESGIVRCLQPTSMTSLYALCMSFVSHNISLVTSLKGFPESVGEQIFKCVVDHEILFSLSASCCEKVLKLFDEAYGSLILEELLICCRSSTIFENNLHIVTCFRHLVKLDVTGCQIGDQSDLLQFIGQLSSLTHLSLKQNEISNDGLRRLTTPIRCLGVGPSKLEVLDLSYNHKLSATKFLRCFSQLKGLCLTCTAVTAADVSDLSSWLSLVRYDQNTTEFSTSEFSSIINRGWASDLMTAWFSEDRFNSSLAPRATSSATGRVAARKFYGKQTNSVIVTSLEKQQTGQTVLLVASRLVTGTGCRQSSTGHKTVLLDSLASLREGRSSSSEELSVKSELQMKNCKTRYELAPRTSRGPSNDSSRPRFNADGKQRTVCSTSPPADENCMNLFSIYGSYQSDVVQQKGSSFLSKKKVASQNSAPRSLLNAMKSESW